MLQYNRIKNKMFNRREDRQHEGKMPIRYESTKDEFKVVDKYIQGITREDVSQFITSFPFIYEIYKNNKPNDQWNLLDQLMQAPSESDGPGFIYGFMDQSQNNMLESPYWIKMGRTKQNPPQKRIFQWERDQNIQLTQIFTVRSLYNKKLQKLVHSLFAYARQNRYINGKLRIQWFKFNQITLTAAAVNILNHIMNSIHTSHLVTNPKIYLNRKLKQFTDKIIEANNHIKDITNNSSQLIAESIARDLGIQIGTNSQLKVKLANAVSISEILELTSSYTLGKQMQECFQSIKKAKNLLDQYTSNMNQFEVYVLQNINQIYNKTKIKEVGKFKNQHQNHYIPQIHQEKIISNNSTQKKTKNNKHSLDTHQSTQKKASKKIKVKVKAIQEEIYIEKQQNSKKQFHQINEKFIDKQNKEIKSSCDAQNQTKEKNQTRTAVIYNQNGEARRQKIIVSTKQITQNNKALIKYKRNEGQKHQKYNLRPSRQKTYDTISKLVESDLNETKTEQQIQIQTASIGNQSSPVNQLYFQIQKISELIHLLKGKQFDLPYIVSSNSFNLDVSLFELDFNFVIMAKKIIVSQNIQISKGKNKGILRMFCQEINIDGKNVNIDKNCAKYVGIFKIQSAQAITPIDSYHKRKGVVDQVIKNLSKRFINIFSGK